MNTLRKAIRAEVRSAFDGVMDDDFTNEANEQYRKMYNNVHQFKEDVARIENQSNRANKESVKLENAINNLKKMEGSVRRGGGAGNESLNEIRNAVEKSEKLLKEIKEDARKSNQHNIDAHKILNQGDKYIGQLKKLEDKVRLTPEEDDEKRAELIRKAWKINSDWVKKARKLSSKSKTDKNHFQHGGFSLDREVNELKSLQEKYR